EGATIVVPQLPEDVPGLDELEDRRQKLKDLIASLHFTDAGNGIKKCTTGKGQLLLAANVQAALEYKGIGGEALVKTGLKFIRRQIPGGKYYYLVNHSAKAVDATIPLNLSAAAVLIMDPQSGEYGRAASALSGGKTMVHVQMQPGEALILKATVAGLQTAAWKYIEKTATPVTLAGEWKLHFTNGGPVLPADRILTVLGSWTNAQDTATASFSGTGVYSTAFDLTAAMAPDYLLDLGKVCESAHVYVNGKDAGICWSIPFSARVGRYLKPGKNILTIEVCNLMANRIRYMDQNGIPWRKYHEINFVNINYKPFDASKWDIMPSGLIGPVTLTPLTTKP
ncbi:MAG TPA: hypothetical protein VLD19_15680, partial [Chitinophagaceae bacterium]|nr:hypothetical protein [Chitinophagaceae bacterium]